MISIQKQMALFTTLVVCGTFFSGCKEPARPPQKPAAQVALPVETLTTSSEVIPETNLPEEQALSESITQESEILPIEMIVPSAFTTEETDETSSNRLSLIEMSPADSNL